MKEETKERNHQVGIMGKVYSKAATVIVWLGIDRVSGTAMQKLFDSFMQHFQQGTKTKPQTIPSVYSFGTNPATAGQLAWTYSRPQSKWSTVRLMKQT